MAAICRYGRQDFITLLGHRPTPIESRLFSRALKDMLEAEYQTPQEFRPRE